MPRPRSRILLAWASAAALASCRAEAPRERLAVADVRQAATSLVLVALADGCAAREGLEVQERTFELGRDALALLRDGGADVAVVYETPLLGAAFHDPRLRVLTKLHTSTLNTRLVARRDRAIASFRDLRGKRIGFAGGTNAEFFVDLALRFGGVPRDDVAIAALEPADSAAALAAGELDAAVLSDPFAALAERALGAGGRTLQTDLYSEASLLVTRADVVEARGPALRALVRALACAEGALQDRPEQSFGHVRARFPEVEERALREQLARVSPGIGLDNVLLHLLRVEGAWLQRAGLAEGARPDPLALVERSVLVEVAPETVMLLPRRGP